MKKKLLLTCALTLGILATGTVAYTSLSSAQEVQEETSQTTEVNSSSVPIESTSNASDSTDEGSSQSVETSSSESQNTETSDTPQSSTISDNQTSEPKASAQKNTPSQLTRMEQEHEAFTEEAVKQDFYLEAPDANGKLTYVKATDEKVKELTEDAENNKVSIYQVEHNGEMISVLSIEN